MFTFEENLIIPNFEQMNYLKKTPLLILLILLLSTDVSLCQNVAQLRGINRDGVYDDTNLLDSWPETGPKLNWDVENLGKGYSSPTVTKDAVYVTGKIDTLDYLNAIDLSGKKLWSVVYGEAWKETFPESRCTPLVDNKHVYVVSSYGKVSCFNIKDGNEIWVVNAYKDFEGAYDTWGIAESLLLVNDKVIFTPGGNKTTMIALNKNTGKLIWESESLKDTVEYASPTFAKYKGKEIIFSALKNHAVAFDSETGKILCKYKFDKEKRPMKENAPIFKDGRLFIVSGGYDNYSYMLELTDDLKELKLAWRDTIMDNGYGFVVLKDGYIYGSNFINVRKGKWCCIDWNTGKLKYETEWETKGSVSLAGDKLYCMDEKRGNIALVKANPEKFEIISSFKLPKGRGPCWSNPVIKNGIMYIRRGGVLMAFNISK